MRRVLVFISVCLSFGSSYWFAFCQSETPSRLATKQLRRGLLANGPETDLQDRLRQVRTATRADVEQIVNSVSSDTRAADEQIVLSLKDEWGSPTISHQNLYDREFLLVGYSIYHGSTAIPDAAGVVEAFRKDGSKYVGVATLTGPDLDGFSIHFDSLPSPWSTEVWFLVHGQQTQTMQYHERVAIYSFNGLEFKKLWAAANPRRDASYQVTPNAVLLTYDDESAGKHMWLTQRLHLTPGGIIEETAQPMDSTWTIAPGRIGRTGR